MKPIIWTIKEFVEMLKSRRGNEFDGNMAVSGERGNGKSTLINKIFYRIKGFRPWKHQVYDRECIINLLKTQQFGLCWDDEAINSGYKRNFQEKGQQELIKFLTAYRDNFNIYASAIPNFYSLDKDLRDLYFIHLHVIERGIAVVHMPLQGRLYSLDKWDAKYNTKVEASWSNRMQSNPDFKPSYHKLTTFRGYLFFNDMTDKQKALYKEIKKVKREQAFKTAAEKVGEKNLTFLQKLYNQLIEGKLTMDFIKQACLMEGKKHSSVTSSLNIMLTDNGISNTMKDFLKKTNNKDFHNKIQDQINQIIPDI